MPSNHFANFFKNLKTLTHIDVQGSLVDDVGFDGKNLFVPHFLQFFSLLLLFTAIGINGDHLVSLKASSTAITNVGVKNLCLGDSRPCVKQDSPPTFVVSRSYS